MGYLHIDNLYKNEEILMFKECYALEKIHGTSAHIHYKEGQNVGFFSGGVTHANFVNLFDKDFLNKKCREIFPWPEVDVFIYGEAYGGKCQGMSATYGKELKFIVFDVKIGHSWLSVPQAEEVAKYLNLDFVWYTKCSTDVETLNTLRDRPSEQAKRNGCGDDKRSEGIVLRPLIELKKNSGERIIAKHKRVDFQETKTPRVVGDKLKVLTEANAICDEWCTEMRLTHVLDKFPNYELKNIPEIIKSMIEDITREGNLEIIDSKEVRRIISNRTALMVKKRLNFT